MQRRSLQFEGQVRSLHCDIQVVTEALMTVAQYMSHLANCFLLVRVEGQCQSCDQSQRLNLSSIDNWLIHQFLLNYHMKQLKKCYEVHLAQPRREGGAGRCRECGWEVERKEVGGGRLNWLPSPS